MRIRELVAAGAAIGSAAAFSNTSPFFLFSTARLSADSSDLSRYHNLAQAKTVETYLDTALEGCPSDTYVLVNQPGLSVEDVEGADGLPHLRRAMSGEDRRILTKRSVAGVVGRVDAGGIAKGLSKRCGASMVTLQVNELPGTKSKLPQVITIDLPEVKSGSAGASELSKHDSYLHSVLSALPTQDFTVIYHTSPRTKQEDEIRSGAEQDQVYIMDDTYPRSADANHYKRDTKAYPSAENGTNLYADVPLFEKYQFFNSAIFMGLSVSLVLVAILYVAISAVSGLEVSYYAFSKEFNQANQKKQ